MGRLESVSYLQFEINFKIESSHAEVTLRHRICENWKPSTSSLQRMNIYYGGPW